MLSHYTIPLSIMLSFVAAPAFAQMMAMPFKGEDLARGERLVTDVHGDGSPHFQQHGKDIGVVRYVGDGKWSVLRTANGKPNVNGDHAIYNKPFYAMAPGQVVGCWRNAPENPFPPAHNWRVTQGRIPGAGNFLEIRHDDGNIALYAHAVPGSIPTALCPHNGIFVPARYRSDGTPLRTGDDLNYIIPNLAGTKVANGVRVTAGQFLGKVGNAGTSSGPHLHVHIDSLGNGNGTPIVMRFTNGLTTPATNAGLDETASLDGPWTRVAGNALPWRRLLVWPARTAGNITWNGIGAEAFQRTFEHFTDSGMMPAKITCRNGGNRYDSTWVPASGSFITHHGMALADYAARDARYRADGYQQTSMSQCGTRVVAVWRK